MFYSCQTSFTTADMKIIYNKSPFHKRITLKPVIVGSLCSKTEKVSKNDEIVKLVLFYLLISHSLSTSQKQESCEVFLSFSVRKWFLRDPMFSRKSPFSNFKRFLCSHFQTHLLSANSGIRTFFWSQNCGHLQNQLRIKLTALKFKRGKLTSLLKWLKHNCTQLLHQLIFQDSKV